jgi:HAD superfamily hydrolase (TIGR01459 family)
MSPPRILGGLSEIADAYDAVLCDVWGVIHDGVRVHPGACGALRRFVETRGPVVLISNASRPARFVTPQLVGLGADGKSWSGFVTSGDATRTAVEARAPGRVWAIGPEEGHPIYEGLGLDFTGPGEADFIVCTGLVDDERETPEDYRAALTLAAGRGLVMICANPDKVVQRGSRLVYCAGALADLYAALGGAVVMAGKPHAEIYRLALAEVERLAGRQVPRARILAIGDGLPTDVTGANAAGLDCLFVTAGIHAADTQDAEGRASAARTGAFLAEGGAHAAYALAALAW